MRSGYPDERIEPFLDDLPDGQRRVSQGHSPAQLDADPVVSVVSCAAPEWSARPTAVLAVLGYRLVNYWLPQLPGAVAGLRLRLSQEGADETKPSMPGGPVNPDEGKSVQAEPRRLSDRLGGVQLRWGGKILHNADRPRYRRRDHDGQT